MNATTVSLISSQTNNSEQAVKFTTDVDGTVLSIITYVFSGDTTQFVGKIWDDTSSSSPPICVSAITPYTAQSSGWLILPLTGCNIVYGVTYFASVNYEDNMRPANSGYFLTHVPPIVSGDISIIGSGDAVSGSTAVSHPISSDPKDY